MKIKLVSFAILLTAFLALMGCQEESRIAGTIEEVMDIDCSSDAECPLPGEYAIRSSCPFRTACINGKCAVYCPDRSEWGKITDEPLVGGQRDEKGCLGPAGYSWNDEAGACVREWELNENQRKAAKIAVDHLGWAYATTIIGVDVARCPGCFVVHLEKGNGRNRYDVTLENWEVKEKSLTPDECLSMGGRTVNIVGGDDCKDDEYNAGKVTGFISPNICCLKIDSFEDCVKAGNPVMESYPGQCRAGGRTFTDELDDAFRLPE